MPETTTRLNWLTARAWLDDDGRHVWLRHQCVGRVDESMLPFPTWRASDDGGSVTPSVECEECGMHTFVLLERKRPMDA